jgi:hypothetical protein
MDCVLAVRCRSRGEGDMSRGGDEPGGHGQGLAGEREGLTLDGVHLWLSGSVRGVRRHGGGQTKARSLIKTGARGSNVWPAGVGSREWKLPRGIRATPADTPTVQPCTRPPRAKGAPLALSPCCCPSPDRFLHVYDRLPPDAQQLLVQKHLAPLLDLVPKDSRNSAAASAADMHRRYARMPALNLKAKKAEIAALLLELSRDSKRALVKERSRREQLLSEAVDTLAKWLNEIWRVVFEFRTHFALAHACLLFACDALDQIGNASGGHVSRQYPLPSLTPPQLQVLLRHHVRPRPHHKIHRQGRQVLHAHRRPQSRHRRALGMA